MLDKTNSLASYLRQSCALACLVFANISYADSLINYDQLSFFETPLAYSIADGSLLLEGAVDVAYQSENDGLAEYASQQFEGFLGYETQLANDWEVGASYRVNHDTDRADNTTNELRLFARDQWGLISIGNVSTQLYDQARRRRASGLLGIDRDNFTLPLARDGVFYQWATPTTQLMATFDSDSNIEAGLVYKKPIGTIQYKLSARVNHTENESGDAQNVQQSQGGAIVAQITRGRWTLDSQLMTEQVKLVGGLSEINLTTISAGAHSKFGRLSISLTGINRENELFDTERFYALGLGYDIARGLSINFGSSINNSKLVPERFATYSASLRYQF